MTSVPPVPPDYLVWPPHLRTTSVPAEGVFTGISGPARFETNSFGIRGPELGADRSREYRILFLGGSTVECFYLDQAEAWPQLVMEALPRTAGGRAVWVGNAGRSGHNSRDHVLEMERMVPGLPVDRVVVMMGVNDIGLRLAQDEPYDPRFLDAEANVAVQVKHAFSVVPEDPNLPFYRKGMIARLLGLAPPRERPKPYQVVDGAGHAFETWRELRARGGRRERLPAMEAALGEYARNAERIARAGRRAGVEVSFVTQPALWREGLPEREKATLWLGGVGDFQAGPGAEYYTAGALARGLARYNRTLLDVCERLGLECLDAAGALPRDLTIFYDDCHLHERGARELARLVTEFLSSLPPFAEKPRTGEAHPPRGE